MPRTARPTPSGCGTTGARRSGRKSPREPQAVFGGARAILGAHTVRAGYRVGRMGSDKVPQDSLTTLLHAWREGNGSAFSQLIDKVYAQLRSIAANRLRQMQASATLSPTELLHEALIGIMPSGMAFE